VNDTTKREMQRGSEMSASREVYGSTWEQHNGKIVTIDGIKHVVKVATWQAVYPYRHDVIDVSATVCNRRSEYYRETKRSLGDDWSVDLLASDCELQAEVLSQLQ